MTCSRRENTPRQYLYIWRFFNPKVVDLLLKNMDCRVEHVYSGQEALDKVFSAPLGHFDAIIMDMVMQGWIKANDLATRSRRLNDNAYSSSENAVIAIPTVSNSLILLKNSAIISKISAQVR